VGTVSEYPHPKPTPNHEISPADFRETVTQFSLALQAEKLLSEAPTFIIHGPRK
jgi:hypothetical protein